MLPMEHFLNLIDEMRFALVFHKLPVTNRSLNILAQEEVLPMFNKKNIKSLTEGECKAAIACLMRWEPTAEQYRKLRLEVHSNDRSWHKGSSRFEY